MKSIIILPSLLLALGLMASAPVIDGVTEFRHPDKPDAVLLLKLNAPIYNGFKQEKRGSDYFYTATSADLLICTVQLHRLAGNEGLPFAPNDPRNAMFYFPVSKRLKSLASDETTWGDSTADFMYRQFDLKEAGGMKLNEKHLYAYATFGSDVMVNVHLSKTQADTADLAKMRLILDAFSKKKVRNERGG